MPLPRDIIESLTRGDHRDPFSVLGPHAVRDADRPALAIRVFRPDAQEIRVIPQVADLPPQDARRIHPAGFFEAILPGCEPSIDYRLEVVEASGEVRICDDPYRFPSTLSDYDLHLLGEGTHYRAYQKLGAHALDLQGVSGARFAVWAPNARR
ncbi:MAG: 1,4-alpha-glucan branching enzyme, partial [Armatimonadetes bacterium]|nr:1,4-alpha-glucan branching enzyme [Armatimonadota bacterium]